jgi:putative aldouronate transport system substrate-binding protein
MYLYIKKYRKGKVNKMKKYALKASILMLVLAMVLGALAGCGGSGSAGTSETTAASTQASDTTAAPTEKTLEPVTVTFYFMGDPVADDTAFMQKLNEMTQKDLNATIVAKYSSWTDWAQKYNLMLASDTEVDATYGANWLNYADYANKGAFLALDDLIAKDCPTLKDKIPQDRWDGVKVGGKIYAVPSMQPSFTLAGMQYRQDLVEKYNLQQPKDLDTMEAYFKAVQKEPGMSKPVGEAGFADYLFVPTTKYDFFDTQAMIGPSLCFVADPAEPTKSVLIYDLPEYAAFVNKMKSWADMGFWSKSILSSKDQPVQLFQAGKAAAILSGHNPDKYSGQVVSLATTNPTYKLGYFPYNEMNGLYHTDLPVQNVTCIPKNAKNGERALMLVEKFMTDKNYYNLLQYGVEGVNYNMSSDGTLRDMTNIDTKTHSFGLSSWAWRSTELNIPGSTDWKDDKAFRAGLMEKCKPFYWSAFILNTAPVQSQLANIQAIKEQYAKPLEMGLAGDPDKALATLKEKLKEAGIEAVQAEMDKQLAAYAAQK